MPGPTRRVMEPQLDRLTRLEESLLLLARLDAGTLPLHPEPSDLFTLLMMAADNLQPLAEEAESPSMWLKPVLTPCRSTQTGPPKLF